MTIERKHIYSLTLIALFVFFFHLGRADFWGDLVARNASMAREMLQRGEWVVPYVNGHPDYEKPILWIWVLSLFSAPLGVNEFSVRLPCALAALGNVYVVYALGRRLANPRCGFRAAVVYMTCVKVMYMARTPRIDMSLALLIALAFFFFLRGYQDGDRRRTSYLLVAVFAALGVLDKGPVGVVIPGGGIFFYLLFRRDLGHIFKLLHPRSILAFVLVVVPWYAAVHLATNGEFTREFFLYHNLTMFAAYSRSQPWWFYFPQLLYGFLPWSVFLPFAFTSAFGKKERRAALFPLAWFLWVFVFFSMSVYKRSDYLLPLYPAAALLIALFWESLDEKATRWKQFAPRLMAILLVVICLAALVLAVLISLPGLADRVISSEIVDRYSNDRDRDAMVVFTGILKRDAVFLIVFLSAAAAFFLHSLRRLKKGKRGAEMILAGAASVMIVLHTYYLVSILPELDRDSSQRAYSEELMEVIGPHDRFALYDFWRYEFGYYMNRDVTELQVPDELRDYFSRPERGYCVVKRKWIHEALDVIGDLPHRVEPALGDRKGKFAVIVRAAE